MDSQKVPDSSSVECAVTVGLSGSTDELVLNTILFIRIKVSILFAFNKRTSK
jgi:hypothetical protein